MAGEAERLAAACSGDARDEGRAILREGVALDRETVLRQQLREERGTLLLEAGRIERREADELLRQRTASIGMREILRPGG
jgi:hypothetical protein